MQLAEILSRINVDEQALLRRFCGNRALMERFIRKFVHDQTFAELNAANGEGDQGAMFRAAHTLKGVSANLGFDRLYESSSALVEDLREGGSGRLPEKFQTVSQEYQRIISWIARLDEE